VDRNGSAVRRDSGKFLENLLDFLKRTELGGFSNQPRRLDPGGWIIVNDASRHQRIEEQPDSRQVLPLCLMVRLPAWPAIR
jgi:hypothetical protein